MGAVIRLPRSDSAGHAATTFASGAVTYCTDTGTIHAHDGITPGGHPLATAEALEALAARVEALETMLSSIYRSGLLTLPQGITQDVTIPDGYSALLLPGVVVAEGVTVQGDGSAVLSGGGT